jgi:8-oxo-dGTP pyrophosphatase MutT (NUDIX family)
MTLNEHRVRRSDGTEGIYAVVDKPDFALIVPVADGGFHLVTQYRYPTRERSLEFPQGTSEDEALTAAELAQAELIEETGLRASRIVPLGTISPAPGTTSQRCNVFVASDLQPDTSRQRDAEEIDLQSTWLSEQDLVDRIRAGQVTDGATIAAYTLWRLTTS